MTTATPRRIALLNDGSAYIGPALAREWAQRGHDLVIGDPADGLVEELSALGATVHAVAGVRDLAAEGAADRLVAAGLERFGRIDAACAFTGRIVGGHFRSSSVDELRTVFEGCMVAPYHFLRAVVEPMVAAGSGQVLLLTSAAGARPSPGVPLYSAARAGATMMARNVAGEVARHGVQVNVVGTNFMDFPEFHRAAGTDDPEVRAAFEQQVPMRRFGTLEECAAFSMAFLDGSNGFTTGQFVAYAGGWA